MTAARGRRARQLHDRSLRHGRRRSSPFRLAGIAQVKRLTESIAADRMRILPVLAAALHR
jgi:hypothetical protein